MSYKKQFHRAFIAATAMSMLVTTPVLAKPSIEELEENKTKAEQGVADTNSKLVELLTEFDVLKADMNNQEQKIILAAEDLKKAEEVEKEQYEDMKLRIKYMYEEGNATYIQTLLEAENFSDLLNKAEYVQSVHGYDRKMLKTYQKAKDNVASQKAELEAQKADMEFMATEYERQQENLQNTLSTMRAQVEDFDAKLSSAKAEAEAARKQFQAETEAMLASSSKKETTQNQNKPASKPKPEGGAAAKPDNNGSSNSGSGGTSNSSSSNNAALGQKIVNEALKYVGNPYVFGGNSLTNGIDCSGFTSQIHGKFGISVPRSSSAQRSGGRGVSFAEAKPGDIICYSGHVAIYMGNNKIVHASNSAPYPKGGIKVTNDATYRTILAVRRYW